MVDRFKLYRFEFKENWGPKIIFEFKATCLEGPKRQAVESDAYGTVCKCASYTSAVPLGDCIDNKQEYQQICDKDSVTFANATKNECDGPAIITGECGAFIFGEWEWLYCSENCGEGVEVGTRTCTPRTEIPCPESGPEVYQERPCQIQKCLTCANYANYCDNRINTQCVDVTLDNGEVTVCQL